MIICSLKIYTKGVPRYEQRKIHSGNDAESLITNTKNKTILKDNVKIGSNTVLVAPVEIGEGTNIGAGSVITKNIGEWALGLTRAPLRIIENWVKH